MKVPLLDLQAQYQTIKPEIDRAIQQVLDSGAFVLGSNVAAFEEEVAAYLGVKHAVGVASGTDALILALRALGVGPEDEVIIPSYTFFATAGAVLHAGARPILVDICADTYALDVKQVAEKITPRTKAIIPVHLYGHPVDMQSLLELAGEHRLKIVEDNAQAFGARYKGRPTGSFGAAAGLSFFPSKNLGGYGDGGMVVTDSDDVAQRARMLRSHGWRKKYHPELLGYNSRLDALQAAILRVKLNYLDQWNDARRELAQIYTQRLEPLGLGVPCQAANVRHVYHLYIIRTKERRRIQSVLKERGVASAIYYPLPLHLTELFLGFGYQNGDFPISEQASEETLALPLFPEMSPEQLDMVVTTLEEALAGVG